MMQKIKKEKSGRVLICVSILIFAMLMMFGCGDKEEETGTINAQDYAGADADVEDIPYEITGTDLYAESDFADVASWNTPKGMTPAQIDDGYMAYEGEDGGWLEIYLIDKNGENGASVDEIGPEEYTKKKLEGAKEEVYMFDTDFGTTAYPSAYIEKNGTILYFCYTASSEDTEDEKAIRKNMAIYTGFLTSVELK